MILGDPGVRTRYLTVRTVLQWMVVDTVNAAILLKASFFTWSVETEKYVALKWIAETDKASAEIGKAIVQTDEAIMHTEKAGVLHIMKMRVYLSVLHPMG